jgi:hypothetical protein
MFQFRPGTTETIYNNDNVGPSYCGPNADEFAQNVVVERGEPDEDGVVHVVMVNGNQRLHASIKGNFD